MNNADIPVRRVIINLCQACIDGVGQECHTPGCALFLHSVDLPIGEELIEDVPPHFLPVPGTIEYEIEQARRAQPYQGRKP